MSEEFTDVDGELVVTRFGLLRVTIDDPRYHKRAWEGKDIPAELIVERSVLGNSLDHLLTTATRVAGER